MSIKIRRRVRPLAYTGACFLGVPAVHAGEFPGPGIFLELFTSSTISKGNDRGGTRESHQEVGD